MIACRTAMPVEPTVCNYDHLGRVLAERHRVGPGYIRDTLIYAKARRRMYQ
jgi:hypothetical protein